MSASVVTSSSESLTEPAAAKQTWLWFAVMMGVVVIVSALAWSQVQGTKMATDEMYHYGQIEIYLNGDYYQHPRLVTLPSYHVVMAVVAKVTGLTSLDAIRFLSMLIGLLVPMVVFAMLRDLPADLRAMRALAVFLIPTLFPLNFWVYTDPTSLLFVLAAMWATTSRRYFWAGLLAIGATLVRQNNIIWLGVCHAIGFVREEHWRFTFASVKRYLAKTPAFLLGYALFAVFVVVNKGIAMGAAEAHPSFRLYTGNIALAIVMALVLQLPMHLSRATDWGTRSSRWWAGAGGLALLVAAAHYLWFDPSNEWNQPAGYLNNALAWTASDPTHLLISCVPLVLGVLALSVARLRVSGLWMMYPATCLYLGSSWLITGRYSIVPLALLIVYTDQRPRWAEVATVVLLATFCVLFYTHGFYI